MDANTTSVGINVLGPVEAVVHGGPARLGGRRPKAVLAVLLLARGALVSEDQIIDAVWEDQPPEKPRQALHTYVADLRRTLEPQRGARQRPTVLLRHASGYSLQIGSEAVDATRFARLVLAATSASAESRPGDALSCADRALRLWAGPAYADLADHRFLHPEIGRLEEWRSAACEIRIASRLALGEHRVTLVESEELTTRYPLRESGWALRALALYHCGRQAEALEVLGSARRLLREELGVSPGPELTRLTRRVLTHDPGLQWPAQAAVG